MSLPRFPPLNQMIRENKHRLFELVFGVKYWHHVQVRREMLHVGRVERMATLW